MAGLKKFITNKNTITLFGILAGAAVLLFGYSYRVSQAVNLISVPAANTNIASRSEIVADQIKYVKVPSTIVQTITNMVTDPNAIKGKYVAFNTFISNNSFFLSDALMDKEEMPDSAIDDIPDGYTIFTLPVNMASTLGNSIYPGDKIDLYISGTSDSGKIIYGCFIIGIEVLDVKDTNGQHVFKSDNESRTPANLLFAVPDDLHQLLEKAKRITNLSLVPVLRNKNYNPTTSISSNFLKTLILNKSVSVPMDN